MIYELPDDYYGSKLKDAVNDFVSRIDRVPPDILATVFKQGFMPPPCRALDGCPSYYKDGGVMLISCGICPARVPLDREAPDDPDRGQLILHVIAQWRAFRDYVNDESVRNLYHLRAGVRFYTDLRRFSWGDSTWVNMRSAALSLLGVDIDQYLEGDPHDDA